jgi:hypothetical protein
MIKSRRKEDGAKGRDDKRGRMTRWGRGGDESTCHVKVGKSRSSTRGGGVARLGGDAARAVYGGEVRVLQHDRRTTMADVGAVCVKDMKCIGS